MKDYPPLIIQIPAAWEGRSIDCILRSEMGFSRSGLRKLKKGFYVRRNGRPVALWEKVFSGDTLSISIPLAQQQMTGEDIPVNILYEDADLVVVDKAPGMVVHPVRGHYSGTLANALIYRWTARGEAAGFHPVHRLDRWTSGLLLVAKSPWAHQQLDRTLQRGKLVRTYLALASGILPRDSGKIEAPIVLTEDRRHRGVAAEGRPSSTRFRVIRRLNGATLVLCRLATGRTHQIRVHMAHTGHHLVGDEFYGDATNRFHRPALHAVRIRFVHPRAGTWMRFHSPPPEDMSALLSASKE